MKQVRNTLGRLVRSLVGRSRNATPVQRVQPPQELDSRVVAQVSGGVADSVQTPRVGW